MRAAGVGLAAHRFLVPPSLPRFPGAAFTRFQTLRLQKIFPQVLAEQLISYGSCQFPTLGFVVERFKAIQAFVPEVFHRIKGRAGALLVWNQGPGVTEGTVGHQWRELNSFTALHCTHCGVQSPLSFLGGLLWLVFLSFPVILLCLRVVVWL